MGGKFLLDSDEVGGIIGGKEAVIEMDNQVLTKVIAGIIVIGFAAYCFVFHFLIYPKIIKWQWVRKVFRLDKRLPKLDLHYSGWGFVYAWGIFVGFIIVAIITVFVYEWLKGSL